MYNPRRITDSKDVFESFGIKDVRADELLQHMEIECIKWKNSPDVLGVDVLLEKLFAVCENEPELALLSYAVGGYLALQWNPLAKLMNSF